MPRIDGAAESVFGPNACEFTAGASSLILCPSSSAGATWMPRCNYVLRRLILEIGQRRDVD